MFESIRNIFGLLNEKSREISETEAKNTRDQLLRWTEEAKINTSSRRQMSLDEKRGMHLQYIRKCEEFEELQDELEAHKKALSDELKTTTELENYVRNIKSTLRAQSKYIARLEKERNIA